MKITTMPIAKSFRLVESFETSSRGPGCLNIDMKITKKAIGQKPEIISNKIDKNAKTILALSPKIALEM